LGALPPYRGARSDLADRRIHRVHLPLRRGLQVIGGATASLTLSFDGSGDQPGHATRVHARGYTTSRDHYSEDHARGRGGPLLKRLTKRLANGPFDRLAISSAERLSSCICKCYRQCFFRIPFTLALAIRLRSRRSGERSCRITAFTTSGTLARPGWRRTRTRRSLARCSGIPASSSPSTPTLTSYRGLGRPQLTRWRMR
jgi:hypothetical protein